MLRFPWFLLPFAAALLVPSVRAGKLDEILDRVREKTGVPGLAAAVVLDGKIVEASARGVREHGKPEAVTLSDQWLIGSCTKPMTQLLHARLAARNPALAAERTLAEALPGVEMRAEYRGVTLGDLANHTAGLPSYTRITPQLTPSVFEQAATPTESRAKFAAHLLQEAPAGERGKFLYSNAGYALLGHVLERASGRSWEELMAAELFAPLGMKAASIGFAPGAAKAQGHVRTTPGFRPTDGGPQPKGALAPAGAVCLPIEDFARFAMAALADKSGPDGRIQAGGQGHYTAACALWPSRGFGVVVCTNVGEGDAILDEVVRTVRQTYAPDVPQGGGPGRRLGVVLRGEADRPGGTVQIAIDSVIPGSLAEQGGLKAGDVLISINGQAVTDLGPNTPPPGLREPGAKIVVQRGGQKVELTMPK
ncbi:MAG: serine hydrolase [Verrucomicrobia bacterium]|nr:serine hydrolase [Verrucomicrobiota bacterium]